MIADPDGGYLARFFDANRGDVILNPFDDRTAHWNSFADILEPFDVEQLASSLIPTGDEGSGREWRGYARTFFTAAMRRSYANGQRDGAELWRLLPVAPSEELRSLLAGAPAQPFLDPDNGKLFGSIRSVAGSAIAALQYIQGDEAATFSVRDWIKRGRGALFHPLLGRADRGASHRVCRLATPRDFRGDECSGRGPAPVVHRR